MPDIYIIKNNQNICESWKCVSLFYIYIYMYVLYICKYMYNIYVSYILYGAIRLAIPDQCSFK